MSVRQELQADCFAGVWANHSEARHKWLEAGDIEEALGTATAIGDDRLQRQTQGTVVPDAFTHGTSQQRVRWFKTGFARGGCAPDRRVTDVVQRFPAARSAGRRGERRLRSQPNLQGFRRSRALHAD